MSDSLDNIIIEILKTVNSLPDLNKPEFRIYSYIYGEIYKNPEKSEYNNIDCSLPELGINRTLLHYAAKGGCEKVADALIAQGANVNAKDRWRYTPLHLAAEKGHLHIVNTLLKEGADVDAKNEYKETPLHLAVQDDHTEVAKVLLEAGADVNVENYSRRTPLHWAAESGNQELAKLLVNRGADPSLPDYEGDSPLFLAKEFGHKEVEEILVKKSPGTNGDITKSSEEAKEMQLKTNKAIAIGAISGSLTALACAIIATALFATGIIAVETLTVLAAISIVAVVGLAVGKVTYVMSKPNTEINEAKTDQQKQSLEFSNKPSEQMK